MSIENVNAFYEKVEEDKALQEQLKALLDESIAQRAVTTSKLIDIAASVGCKFTPADLDTAQKERVTKIDQRLREYPDPLDCMPGWKIM